MLAASLGSTVKSESDAYRISLSTQPRFTIEHIIDALTSDFDINKIMSVALKGQNDITWKTFCVGKKFGFYDKTDVYEKTKLKFHVERNIDTPMVREAFRELYHEKFDLEGTQKIIEMIKTKKINIEWIDVDTFSKLGEPIADTKHQRSNTNPASIHRAEVMLVRNRRLTTKQRLLCARCGLWQQIMTPSENHPSKCKYCKGQQITCTYHYDTELVNIIKKNYKGKKLTSKEKKQLQNAWKVSSLIATFGKIAYVVMAGAGVGPEVAGRILKNRLEDDDDYLIKQIIIEERKYTKTREFWKN